jgi:hypothetical protein
MHKNLLVRMCSFASKPTGYFSVKDRSKMLAHDLKAKQKYFQRRMPTAQQERPNQFSLSYMYINN